MSKGFLTLAIIALAQLVALFLVYVKIVAVERDLAAATSGPRVESYPYRPAQAAGAPAQPNRALPFPAEDRIREIIRDELRAELRHASRADRQAGSAAVENPVDTAEMASRRELVSEQINYFTSVGRISDAEMQKLQLDIAKLDAAGRAEALAELSRALNSGRLEGRL